jgi:O-antigen polymerase
LSDFELYSHQVTITFWLLMGWVGAFVKAQQKTTIINHN